MSIWEDELEFSGYIPIENEKVIHKCAIKTRAAVISLVQSERGPLIVFKIFHLYQDGAGTSHIKVSNGKKEQGEFYLKDLDRGSALAEVITSGRPFPYGLPRKIESKLDTEEKFIYESERVISLATDTKAFTRTCRFFRRPEYGNAVRMEIIIRPKNSHNIKPPVFNYDYVDFEALVAFSKLKKALL